MAILPKSIKHTDDHFLCFFFFFSSPEDCASGSSSFFLLSPPLYRSLGGVLCEDLIDAPWVLPSMGRVTRIKTVSSGKAIDEGGRMNSISSLIFLANKTWVWSNSCMLGLKDGSKVSVITTRSSAWAPRTSIVISSFKVWIICVPGHEVSPTGMLGIVLKQLQPLIHLLLLADPARAFLWGLPIVGTWNLWKMKGGISSVDWCYADLLKYGRDQWNTSARLRLDVSMNAIRIPF